MINKIKIKDIGEVISGSTPKTNIKEYWNGNNNWITPAELTDKSYLINETERKITDLAIEKTSLKKLPKGTVLLTSRAPIGKVAIANTDMYCNQGFKNIVCNEKIYNKFLYYFLKSKTDYLNSLGRGATFKEISKGIVENIDIPYYEFEEQKLIVNKLDIVQDLISLKENQIKDLDNLIKSMFIDMFENKEYPKEEFTNISKEIYAGGDKPKDISQIKDEKYLYPVYANGFENEGLQGYSKEYRTENEAVTISARGTIGYSFVRDGKFTPIVRLITIIPNERVKAVYLKYAIDNLNIAGSGTSQAQLTVPNIKKHKITIPPIELQNRFTDFVKQIAKQKDDIVKKIEELQKVYEGLTSEYF